MKGRKWRKVVIEHKQSNSDGFESVERRAKGELKEVVVEDSLAVVEHQAIWSRFSLAPIQTIVYLPAPQARLCPALLRGRGRRGIGIEC
jgi:hypothetical protein